MSCTGCNLGFLLVAPFVDGGVQIHSCGNGFYWFRSYSESLWKSAKVTKAHLPLSFGASLWLRMPSLRSCSVGPPPSAIHGRGRLTRHPCRVAHCAEPPLGLSRVRCLNIKSCRRANARPVEWWEARAVHGSIVGAWLASDGGLTADQSLSGVHHYLWELACLRWRPDRRPISFCRPLLIVPTLPRGNAARDAPRSVLC